MTRETKVGMVVGTTFLCLLGVVVASKLRRPENHVELEAYEFSEPQNGDPKASAGDPKPPSTPVAQGANPAKLDPRVNNGSSGLPAVTASGPAPIAPVQPGAPTLPTSLPNLPAADPLVQAAQNVSTPMALPQVGSPMPQAPSITAMPTQNADPKAGQALGDPLVPALPKSPTTALNEGASPKGGTAAPVGQLPPADPLASLPAIEPKDPLAQKPSSPVPAPIQPVPPVAQKTEGPSPLPVDPKDPLAQKTSGPAPLPIDPRDPLAQKTGGPAPLPIDPKDPLAQKPGAPTPPPISITPIAPPPEPAKGNPSAIPMSPAIPAVVEPVKQPEPAPVAPPLVAPGSDIKAPAPGQLPPVLNANPASAPSTGKVVEAPKVNIGTIGAASDNVPVTPPLTTPLPGSLSPAAAVPASLPKVSSHSDEVHFTENESDFRRLSQKYYKTDKYARALLEYNRQHLLAKPNLRQDPPVLQPQQPIYYPPPSILEQRYGNLMSAASATPQVGQIGGPAVIAPSTANSAAPVQLRQPMPLTSVSGSTSDRTISYTVQQPQHIFAIAQQTLGDGHAWTEILRLNPWLQRVPDLNQAQISAGTVLQLPANAKVH
jgi:hypothetical protein